MHRRTERERERERGLREAIDQHFSEANSGRRSVVARQKRVAGGSLFLQSTDYFRKFCVNIYEVGERLKYSKRPFVTRE